MRDHPSSESAPGHEVWTGRATNRIQWLLALVGAACLALGIELAVDSAWSSGVAPLVMSVVGCIAAGLLVLFGTLAFVPVALRVDKESLEVRCGHIGQRSGSRPSRCRTDRLLSTAPRKWVTTPRNSKLIRGEIDLYRDCDQMA